jgi:hypothetical protein
MLGCRSNGAVRDLPYIEDHLVKTVNVQVISRCAVPGPVQPGFSQLPLIPPATDSAWVYPQGDLTHVNGNLQVPLAEPFSISDVPLG